MRKLLSIAMLLIGLTAFAQDWQLKGTKYPNATNQGDTVSLATKVPLWDTDNLQNYFADLGDILALNPVPTLQSVTDSGNETTNGLTASNLKAHYFQALNAANNDRIFIEGGVSGNHIKFVRGVSGEYSHRIDADMKDIVFETTTEAASDSYRNLVLLGGERDFGDLSDFTSAEFYGRVKGKSGQDEDDFITLGQMQDSISSHTPDLSDYVDRTTNQEVFGQKTWQDINTFNGGVTIFNGRILSDYMGLRPLTTLPSSNDTGRFGYLSSGYFAFKPIDKPTAYLDFTNLTSNEYFDFPDKSGTIALLDDIPEPIQETGNFVPTLSTIFGGTITSFTNLESYYSRLGDQVTVVVHLAEINSSGDVGNLIIGNLPFPFKTGYIRGSTGSARVYPESGVNVVSACLNQGSEIYVVRNNDDTSSTVYDIPFVNGKVSVTLTYITD